MFVGEVTNAECLNSSPSVTYEYYQNNIKAKPNTPNKKGWVCKICGYFHEGDELPNDFICPICKHGKEDLKKYNFYLYKPRYENISGFCLCYHFNEGYHFHH
mgnify:CR=1 FL=1